MKRLAPLALALSLLAPAAAARAELLRMRQVLYGMDWAVCAHAVRVAMRKIEGVEKVEVSLNQGTVDLTFRPGNRVTVERVRQVAVDGGFAPKQAEVRIAGRIVHREKPALAVTGLDVVYLLEDHPSAKGLAKRLHDTHAGKEMVLRGVVPEARKAGEPRVLRVREAVPR